MRRAPSRSAGVVVGRALSGSPRGRDKVRATTKVLYRSRPLLDRRVATGGDRMRAPPAVRPDDIHGGQPAAGTEANQNARIIRGRVTAVGPRTPHRRLPVSPLERDARTEGIPTPAVEQSE